MSPGLRAAACSSLAAAWSWGFTALGSDETSATVDIAARRYEQKAGDSSTLASQSAELGVLQANIQRKSQIQDLTFVLSAKGEGGRSATGGVRFLTGSFAPAIGYEGDRQTHHLLLSLAKSYDSQGMARLPLRDQLDGVTLTDEQKNRYTQAGVGTDHYFSLTPRSALVAYLSTDRLDREIVTRTYVAGGFVERELNPTWKLRLGGGALRVVYDGTELRASGPEASSLHELSDAWRLTVKFGTKDYKAETGRSTAQTGGATIEWKRDADAGTLGFERQTGQKPVTAEVTTSDVTTAKGRVGAFRQTALEGALEERRERWLEGRDQGARADTLNAGLSLIFGWGGLAKTRDDRSRQGVVLSLQREDMRIKSGAKAYRQVGSLGVERVW